MPHSAPGRAATRRGGCQQLRRGPLAQDAAPTEAEILAETDTIASLILLGCRRRRPSTSIYVRGPVAARFNAR